MTFSGNDITEYLMKLLIENGLTFSRHYDKHVIKDIKEKKCYVSNDFDTEMVNFQKNASSKEIIFELPDKQVINIGRAAFSDTPVDHLPTVFLFLKQ